MRTTGLLLLLAVLCSAVADAPAIRVHLQFMPSNTETVGEVLAVSETGKLLTSGWQKTGVYQVSAAVLPADLFFYQGPGSDTLYVGSVMAQDTAIQLQFPRPLRRNLLGHYICPKCQKADKTVEIVNSIAPMVRATTTATGATYSDIIGRKKYEDCSNGGARSYCQRDKIRF